MFYSLTGVCAATGTGFAVVDCGGVGFKCMTTLTTLRNIAVGEKVTLYTHLNVREDVLDLYGFSTQEELEHFRTLLGVSGVGPKMALSVLSDLTADRFAAAVVAGDYRLLTKVPGVGTKTAQRIVLELKDKLSAVSAGTVPAASGTEFGVVDVSVNEAAVEALQSLGFGKNEAASAVARCGGGSKVEEVLQKALKLLAR